MADAPVFGSPETPAPFAEPPAPPSWQDKFIQIFLWIFCTLLFAFLPIGLIWLLETTRGRDPEWIRLLGAGDVLLITAVLSADAFGRIVKLRELNVYYARVIGTVLSGAVLLTASLYFAMIAVQIEQRKGELAGVANKIAQEMPTNSSGQVAVSGVDLQTMADAILKPPVNYQRIATHSLYFLIGGIAISIGAILMEED
jgi:hypothetical protein